MTKTVCVTTGEKCFFHSHFQVSPENREELEFLLLLEELGSEGITEDVIKVTRSL